MAEPINITEMKALAEKSVDPMVFDYYAGGAGDEETLADNRSAWSQYKLVPRVLVDVARVELATTLLGQSVAFPILSAPCGFNRLVHDEGERAVARAMASLGSVQVLSTASTCSIESVAEAAPEGQRWFQLYCYKDRGVTRALVERAEAAGCSALCLTVDVPAAGRRERDIRNQFHLPKGIEFANLAGLSQSEMTEVERQSALHEYVTAMWDSSLDWSLLPWLRSITKLPLVLKGVLHPEDARLAAEHGAAAIVVSNHGGRQLDGAVATAEILPRVVQAAGNELEIYVDGGIRRGVDVLRALALGARAVLVGRPYLWGLAIDGQRGVERVFGQLRDELELAMRLVGKTEIAQLDRSILLEHRA